VQKVDERKSEIESKEFKNVETDFEEESLALKRTTVANKDINAYVDALKKALISFHNKKMTNVNKTIKELWQKTYRNSDIDYIKIKYEDGARGSHNYRVVMVSGGTELDMRGRCSAGQRVLASIIIRLALAETFCIDCGILALDEPTTNLDEENARSLAVMLQEIINDRSSKLLSQLY
jgi:DNA repair protein RAD50